METKPPLRQRPWYAVVWWVLFIISGSWTLYCVSIGAQLILHPPTTEQQGYGVLVGEAILVVSIPAYCLFFALLFTFPRRRK